MKNGSLECREERQECQAAKLLPLIARFTLFTRYRPIQTIIHSLFFVSLIFGRRLRPHTANMLRSRSLLALVGLVVSVVADTNVVYVTDLSIFTVLVS